MTAQNLIEALKNATPEELTEIRALLMIVMQSYPVPYTVPAYPFDPPYTLPDIPRYPYSPFTCQTTVSPSSPVLV